MATTETEKQPETSVDDEFAALASVVNALKPLSDAARARIIEYTMKRFGIYLSSNL